MVPSLNNSGKLDLLWVQVSKFCINLVTISGSKNGSVVYAFQNINLFIVRFHLSLNRVNLSHISLSSIRVLSFIHYEGSLIKKKICSIPL